MAYTPLDPKQSVDALERQLLATWKHERLFEKQREATRYGPPFVFYEGPPTANGRPGLHHVFSRTIKDLICRYQTMLGHGVTRIAGWDTHGLPVEIEVEKQLRINGKKEIEAYGVEKFNQLCRESVFTYKTDWEALSDRIGYWLDYAHPYITYEPKYIESVWWLLKKLHDKSLLYRGHKVLPYCPRCGTALSSHELALGYETVQTNSVYVTFPLEDDNQRQLVVWTTTPWTLLSNVAAAVHPDLEYGEYELEGVRYIAAAARAADVHVHGTPLTKGTRVAGYPGRDLVGKRYVRPLEVVPLPQEGQRAIVIAAAFVTAEDGTGIVHLAPAFGADDYAAGQQHGLAFVNPVAPDGTFQDTRWPEINGKLVTDKATNTLIIERLKHDGRWLETRPYTHSYPFCWRCDSALIYYARTSWFVRTTAYKARLLEANAEVDWHPPEVGSGRFGEWLENNVDWALSRDRYWGTPLNIWECDRDREHREVIGAFAELAERWGKKLPAGARLVRTLRGETVRQAIDRLKQNKRVRYAVPDYVAHASGFVPDDPGIAGPTGWQDLQWNFSGPYGVDAPDAWSQAIAAGAPGGRGVTVAVLDTGVAYENHGRFRRDPGIARVHHQTLRAEVGHRCVCVG